MQLTANPSKSIGYRETKIKDKLIESRSILRYYILLYIKIEEYIYTSICTKEHTYTKTYKYI